MKCKIPGWFFLMKSKTKYKQNKKPDVKFMTQVPNIYF